MLALKASYNTLITAIALMSQPLRGKCSATFPKGKDATPVITETLSEKPNEEKP